MKVDVLGTGCPKCTLLYDRVAQAAREANLELELGKISDIERIMEYAVMATPALVIDGRVRLSGRVPAVEELKNLLASVSNS